MAAIETDNSDSLDEDALRGRLTLFEQQCRSRGLKITPQRLAIYRELVATDEHPSADWIYNKVRLTHPSISFDTVNRTLLTLAEMGAATTVEGTGDSKRFDGDTRNHQHFKCIRCRRVVDFHHEPFDRIEVPEAVSRHKVLRRSVYFEGICQQCVLEENQTKNSA